MAGASPEGQPGPQRESMNREWLLNLLKVNQQAEDLLSQIRVLMDLSEPTRPENVSTTVDGSTVTISWGDAVGAPRISHYRIYRGGVFVNTDTNSPYVDEGVSNGTHDYTVSAVDANGREGEQSAIVQAIVNVVPPIPDVPINFLASATSATGINLSWQRGPVDPAPTDYDLDYSTASSAGPWTNIAAVGLQTSFSHTALTTATQYWYRLLALNGVVPANSYIQTTETTDSPSSVPAANFIIPSNVNSWDGNVARVPEQGGAARAVQPGDIIQFDARSAGNGTGVAFTLTLPKRTSVTTPITIRGPLTGQAIFRRANPGSGSFVFVINGGQDWILDGVSTDTNLTPDPLGVRHSIKIMHSSSGTSDAPSALLKFQNPGPTYNAPYRCKVRGIEIDGGWPSAGMCLIGISTSTGTASSSFPGQFQESMEFEYNYVRRCRGEGIYVGSNASSAHVPLRYIKVHHNYWADCGGDAVNCKGWAGGTPGTTGATENSVHHNVVIRGGSDSSAFANGRCGIAMRSAKGAVYNNWVENSGSDGISWTVQNGTNSTDPSGTYLAIIYNNIVRNSGQIDAGSDNIVANSDTSIVSSLHPTARVFCNTVHGANGSGLRFGPRVNSASFIRNNVSGSNGTDVSDGPGTSANNLTGTIGSLVVDAVGTYEAGNVNLRLLAPSVASGTFNVDIAAQDYTDTTRSVVGPDKGAYEF